MKKILEWIKENFTSNAFKVFVDLVKSSFKRWYNQVLYLALAIGIYIDWNEKIDSQGGISFFATIIFSYILITTYYFKNDNTAN